MSDPHQEAIERVAAYHECLPSQLSDPTWLAYFEDEINFAEQAVVAERKLEEAMRLLLDRNPEWRARVDAFLRENTYTPEPERKP